MKKMKRLLALLLVAVLLVTNNNSLLHVFATDDVMGEDVIADTQTDVSGQQEGEDPLTESPPAVQEEQAEDLGTDLTGGGENNIALTSLDQPDDLNGSDQSSDLLTDNADQQIMLVDDDNSGASTNIELSARLIINDNKTTVKTGEKFQYELSYTVPNLDAGAGLGYSGSKVIFTLPEYVEIVKDSEGKYSISGGDFQTIEYNEITKQYVISLTSPLPMHKTNTLTLNLTTKNLVTPDNKELNFDVDFMFQTQFKDANGNEKVMEEYLKAGKVTTDAASDWQIEKSNVTENGDFDYVRNGDKFEVTYRIHVSDEVGVDNLGRLGFVSYQVTDTLPVNIPSGGEALEIKNVKLVRGNKKVDTDYTIGESDGHPVSITFTTPDKIQEGETTQNLKVGDVTNTTYEYTVVYPYEPYTTKANEPDFKVWAPENTAELTYTLIGGTTGSDSAKAKFNISVYEDAVGTADVVAEKYIQFNGEAAQKFNADWAGKYNAAGSNSLKFSLYRDESCTEYAYNTLRQMMSNVSLDSKGEVTFTSLRDGTYYLKEENGIAGFKNPGVKKIVIQNQNVKYYDLSGNESDNKLYNVASTVNRVEFVKKGLDAYGSEATELSGATFVLENKNNSEITFTAKSVSGGRVEFHNIPDGTYILKETAVSDALKAKGYEVSSKTYEVTVKGGIVLRPDLSGDNTFLNESEKGILSIVKIDSQNKKILSGAEFELYGPYADSNLANDAIDNLDAEQKAATLTTDKNGTASTVPVSKGYYVLVETKAPANHTAGDPQVIQISEERTTKTVTVENDPQAQVYFRKRGAESNTANAYYQELAGATFEVFDANGNQLYGVKDSDGNYSNVSTVKTNNNEKVVITTRLDITNKSVSNYVTLSPGTYKYKETSVPEPYVAHDVLVDFVVEDVAPANGQSSWNTSQTFTINNYLEYGQIRIVKDASDLDEATASTSKVTAAVNNVKFGVYASMDDAENDKNRIETITTGTVANGDTNEHGIGYSVTQLEIGKTYYVKELSAPSGYALNTSIQSVTPTAEAKLVSVTCTNDPTVSIQITKLDSVTSKAIKGVTFELYESTAEGSKPIQTAVTDDNGIVTFGNLVPNKTYYYKETKTSGNYILDGSWHEITTGSFENGKVMTEDTVKNVLKGDLKLSKKNGSGSAFANVSFKLYTANDTSKDILADTNNLSSAVASKSTDSKGAITFGNLIPGTYWLVETAPAGYETGKADGEYVTDAANEWKVVTVNGVEYFYKSVSVQAGENKGEGYHPSTHEIVNVPTKGKIELSKVVANVSSPLSNPALAGVQFTIYSDAECTDAVEVLADTNASGKTISGWLTPGTYYIKETKVPSGYVQSAVVYEISVTAGATASTVKIAGTDSTYEKIVNMKKGSFTLNKYAAYPVNGTTDVVVEPLQGAKFTLYKFEDNTPVKEIDMSHTATIKVEDLEPGTYWLKETLVPEGFDKVADSQIKVLPDGTVQFGTVVDGNVTWSDASANLKVDMNDYSQKPRIRLIKYDFSNPLKQLDNAKFEVYAADPNGEPMDVDGTTINLLPVKSDGTIGTLADQPHVLVTGTAVNPNNTSTHLTGEALTQRLEAGRTYYFKEIQAPDNYFMNPGDVWVSFEIPANATGEFVVKAPNYPVVNVPGVKTDEDGNPLGNAVLAVFDNETDAQNMLQILKNNYNEAIEAKRLTAATVTANKEAWKIDEIVTSKNGTFSFANLVPNETYYIVELVAPDKYQLDRNEDGNYFYYKVVVSPTIYDKNGATFTEIYKDGVLLKDGSGNNVTTLTIVNYHRHQIWLDKKAKLSGAEFWIEGAAFTIYGSKVSGNELVPDTENVIGTMGVSTIPGRYLSEWLPAGTYFLAETGFPEGFELADRDTDDYVTVGDVRYYKVELGRTEDNTWFKTNPIYNKATVGMFALTKINSVTNAKITATFSVEKYNETNQTFETYADFSSITTDKSDYKASNLIDAGLYRLVETSVETGYTMLTEPVYIRVGEAMITDGETTAEETIVINGESVKVIVYQPTDPVDIKQIAAEGTKAPVLENAIEVENAPKGRFYIHKTGTWNNSSAEELTGVTFAIYARTADIASDADPSDLLDAFKKEIDAATDTPIKTITTATSNKQAIADSELLDAGKYWVIETGFNSTVKENEYKKDVYFPIPVNVVAGQTSKTAGNTIDVVNESNYGKFQISKVDSFDQSAITGVTFTIYKDDPECSNLSANVGTMVGSNGVYTSPLLEPGHNYYLKESAVPNVYDINKNSIHGPFTVKENELTVVSDAIENEHDKALEITKYELNGNEETTTVITAAAKFALYDSKEAALAATASEPGTSIGGVKTTSSGKIKWSNLENGTYYLKELSAPNNYLLQDENGFKAEGENIAPNVYEIKIENKENNSYTYKRSIYNLKKGGFELEKVVNWNENNQDTKIPGNNISFKLYKGTAASEENLITTLTTNAAGKISYRLSAGDYLLVEVMGDGLFSEDKDQYSEDDGSGNYIDASGIHFRVLDSEINKVFTGDDAVNNISNLGRFKLSKLTKDDEGKDVSLNGAEYMLEKYNSETNEWGEPGVIAVNDSDWSNGVYESGLLEEGRYRVTEITAPHSIKNSNGEDVKFTIDPEPIEFDIIKGKTIAIEQYDGILRNFEVTKTKDAKNGNAPLGGVTFELYKANDDAVSGKISAYHNETENPDEVLAAYKEGGAEAEAIASKVTGSADGKVTFTDLEPGKYLLVETAVPEGYELQAMVIDIAETDNYDNLVQTYTLVNASEKGRIIIRKENTDGTLILKAAGKNAEFAIYNISDVELATPIATVKINETGMGQTDLLPAGDYWVVETKAPEDYTLDDRILPVKKQVTVSGDQNPTLDFAGIDAAATEGFTDKVIFQNHTYEGIGVLNASIEKLVRIKDKGAFDTTGAKSEESLMFQDVTAEFKITNLTNPEVSKNQIPLSSFVVTDETLKFYDKNGAPISELSNPTSADYVMNYILLEKSVNDDADKAVNAKVWAKVETAGVEGSGAVWTEVTTVADLTNIASAVKVELPANTIGFRVEYGNADVGFDAGDITFEVTFKQRPSNANISEVRKIVNTASLAWADTSKDVYGADANKTGTVSDTAEVTFPRYDEELPIIGLVNEITNRPTSGMYYSGDSVDFKTTGSVVPMSPKELNHPVMSINLPVYTSLDTTKYPEGGGSGIRATLKNGTVLNFTYEKVIETDEQGREYEKYVLDFGNLVLGIDDSIILEYTADISLTVPEGTISLDSHGFIGSALQLPLTKENPTGMSFEQAETDASSMICNDSGFDAGLENLGNDIDGDKLTYLRRPVNIELTRSNSLMIQKSVKTDDSDWTRTETPVVKPADNYYYELKLVNGGDAVRRARIVDILPFDGDTQEFRAMSGGTIMSRSTDLPSGAGYEQVQLVTVSPESREGAAVTVYYYVENEDVTANVANRDWTAANRGAKSSTDEMPMLTSNAPASQVWTGNWTTAKPSDMTKVTAIGVEVVFAEGYYMESGDTYSVHLTMRAPGYTAEKMLEYEDAIIANTTAATVSRSYGTDESPVTAIDRVSSNEVKTKVYITTGAIGDYAFYDNNDNGIQDLGDIPARNIPVTLYRRKTTAGMSEAAQWEKYKTTVTDQTTGKYEFTGLPCNYLAAGKEEGSTDPADYVGSTYFEYKVEFGIPDGYAATIKEAGNDRAVDSNINANGETDPITLALTVGADGKLVGEVNPTIDAGYVKLVNLGDYVWIDTNKDGIQDESETGLNGVTVNLYKLNGELDTIEGKTPYRTQLTASNAGTDGYYCFTDLPKGYYVVEFDISNVEKPVGYTKTYAFTDANTGTAGTDSDAEFVKGDNEAIKYTEVIHLTEDDMTWDAGVTVYSALGGFVFDDMDYDDTQSIEIEAEDGSKTTGIPLPGTVVTLYKVNEDGSMDPEPAGQQTVGEDGRYLFDKLDAGRYKVHFDYPDEYIGVKAGVGDYLHDSETKFFDDDTLNSGFTDIIVLPADTADLTHDAGAYLLSDLGDYVWEDVNRDGIQHQYEKPVKDIVVTLQQKSSTDEEWTTIETTITDENGRYIFEGLKSSEHYDMEYRVAFGIPRTVDLTVDNSGDDRELDSNALPEYDQELGYFTAPVKPPYGEDDMSIDAGLYFRTDLCEVGDYVWYDVNQDGIQDEDEIGVEGIEVILEYCASGDVWDEEAWVKVGTTKTDANGKYIFTGLQSGAYRVAFGVGDPWTITISRVGDQAADSDAVRPANGYYYSSAFYLNDGDSDMTWDAGIFKISEIEQIIIPIIKYEPFLPITGDMTNAGMLMGLCALSAAVIVLLMKKKKNNA